jgi:hypothetical protein
LECKTKTPAGEVADVRPRREVRPRRLTGHPRKAKSCTEINSGVYQFFVYKSTDYENAYVKPEKTNAITTERINVKPLTGLVLSLIFSPDTYE